jgi:hypothetical protein
MHIFKPSRPSGSVVVAVVNSLTDENFSVSRLRARDSTKCFCTQTNEKLMRFIVDQSLGHDRRLQYLDNEAMYVF